MKDIKILHCSDLHFDTPFSELDKDFAEKRREDLRETFGNIVNLAKKEEVDVLLICGDLFDNQRVMRTTLDYIRRKLEEIPEISVFIAPGNHDPYNEKTFYTMIDWPLNVHIFKSDMEAVYIEDKNITVYGQGFSEYYERESFLKEFSSKFKINEKHINIMALHGDISDRGKTNEYNPITPYEIGESNMDYIALGHRHSFSGIKKEKNTRYSYCGNPEGRAFDEKGEKGVVLGSISKDNVDLNFIPICKRKYEEVSLNIENALTYEDISNNIISSIPKDSRHKDIYKVILLGEVKEDFSINLEVLKEKLSKHFYYMKLKDSTEIKLDYNIISKEFTLKGLYTKKMLEKIKKAEKDEDKRLLKEALKAGIQCLSNKELIL
ncbi:metallophosphoesterase family protein [Clostridium algidicarnis]|uniref:DNA repair exonuclease SbcCD nuclease subunit n=1 Tax=Clostridium algidicarnis DSM 15099 TaxID=1121295 RepID=A0A2S6FZD5_9CLOT|nr:DNA repair exonuclease [Clostridium algidicarnis]MBB6630961.1 DNA repair exonuclease [Clostridium algidicarnis]MBB6698031.1 DNA repair exonuclease [Clostridium algidicarnis]MCB2285951.1 DNA repair exonuclease [Clostridium algidicarnis]PPK48985.1 DNA repair exonuclease SbcCD nuclease subunit [Clostridium algidicarnis DSM 15099]